MQPQQAQMSTSTAPGAARFRLHTVVAIAVRVKKASAWASSKHGPAAVVAANDQQVDRLQMRETFLRKTFLARVRIAVASVSEGGALCRSGGATSLLCSGSRAKMSCTREPWEGPVGLTCASSENSSSKRVGRRRLVSIWRWDVSSLFGKSGQNELHEGTVGGPGRFNVRVQ